MSELMETYDAAIAALERQIENYEYRAKMYQERAAIEYGLSVHELARAARMRVSVQGMREPRDELAALYP